VHQALEAPHVAIRLLREASRCDPASLAACVPELGPAELPFLTAVIAQTRSGERAPSHSLDSGSPAGIPSADDGPGAWWFGGCGAHGSAGSPERQAHSDV